MARNIEFLERAASIMRLPAQLFCTRKSKCFRIIDENEEIGAVTPDEAAEARDLMVQYWS